MMEEVPGSIIPRKVSNTVATMVSRLFPDEASITKKMQIKTIKEFNCQLADNVERAIAPMKMTVEYVAHCRTVRTAETKMTARIRLMKSGESIVR